MNIHTGMTTFQASQANLDSHVTFRNISILLKLERDIHVSATRATYEQLPFLLGITIQ